MSCNKGFKTPRWERNLAKPSIEMLWALADFFECSIDELVGRTPGQVEEVGIYDAQKFRLALIGEDLLKCSEVSRSKGLLAMETCIPDLKGESRFLAFAPVSAAVRVVLSVSRRISWISKFPTWANASSRSV